MREVLTPKPKISERVGIVMDKVVGIFNPIAGYRRAACRKAQGMLSSYRGAEKSRLRKSWLPGAGSPDEDLLPELPDIRERSRDLNRNDATASGITSTISINVVGTGIKPQSRVDKESLGIEEEEAIKFQKKAEREWERWIPYADSSERLDFYEIQHLVDRQILENGESIILPLMLQDNKRPFSLALDIIEADRLATPSDLRSDRSIRSGVKIGERGEPLLYYIKKTHPGDMTLRKKFDGNGSDTYVKIKAKNNEGRKNVLHLYYMNRPGQTRGVPFFAPVLNYFKDKADYMEAELVAARIAACFSIFVKKTGDPYAAADARTTKTDSSGKRIEELEPGIIEYLGQGEEIQSFNPNRPGATFDPFINRILRDISAALGLPYELVAKDFSQTNYSSARAALLEARRYFRVRQEWLARKLCQPVWEMILEEAFLNNDLPAKDFYENRLDWVRARWIAPGWQWVDPLKEAKASQLAMEIGVSSLADETAGHGKDYEEVLEQIAREVKLRKDLGLPPMPSSKSSKDEDEEKASEDENKPTKTEEVDALLKSAEAIIGEAGNEINVGIKNTLREKTAIS